MQRAVGGPRARGPDMRDRVNPDRRRRTQDCRDRASDSHDPRGRRLRRCSWTDVVARADAARATATGAVPNRPLHCCSVATRQPTRAGSRPRTSSDRTILGESADAGRGAPPRVLEIVLSSDERGDDDGCCSGRGSGWRSCLGWRAPLSRRGRSERSASRFRFPTLRYLGCRASRRGSTRAAGRRC